MKVADGGRWAWPLFLVLAYGITWAVQIPAYLYLVPRNVVPTNESNFLLLGQLGGGGVDAGAAVAVLLLCFSFGPSIAGIIVIALARGRPGLRELFSRLAKARIPGKWIAFVVVFPAALSVTAVSLGWVLGGMPAINYRFLVPLALAVPFLLFLIVCTGLAEELGWRGFALPHLQRTQTAERASWILGLAWGLWHVPSVVLLPLMTGAANIFQAAFSVVGLTIGVVGYTIVLTWLYNNTGSLLWIVVLHGYANAWQSYVVLSSGNFTAQVVYGVLPWVLAAWLLKKYGTESLTNRKPRPDAPGRPRSVPNTG
ncbi:CPBP family intramembrane glutamic endopeptidase [Arthrobacter sp. Rue61a]|uniref:CPBP family intramembrane glutamic endopeptidase n=1 Tax=Arthrobacter sp. Rue61a TaxID=1118963 RepID=UPI00027DFA4F|nr:CPBP family intramembrane glutamic endopeptidase [Arthrobacter sp. Rue61a]AFR27494.1 putative CAAX amino terminal protease family protein [Arthrobacter sp. Rue61a]